jgi:hypothetical protein
MALSARLGCKKPRKAKVAVRKSQGKPRWGRPKSQVKQGGALEKAKESQQKPRKAKDLEILAGPWCLPEARSRRRTTRRV